MASQQLTDWYKQVPPATRFLITSTVVISLAGNIGLVNPYRLLLLWPEVLWKFQIWRLMTNFFFAKLGIGFLMNSVFLYQYSRQLEVDAFAGRLADYAYFLLFTCGVSTLASWFTGSVVLTEALLLSILFLWSQKNAHRNVHFYFAEFKAVYFPWVIVGFDFLVSGHLPITALTGCAVGYLYHYLTDVLPAQGGRRWLATPRFLVDMFPSRTFGSVDQQRTSEGGGGYSSSFRPYTTGGGGGVRNRGSGVAGTSASAAGRGGRSVVGYSWGSGRKLGS